LVGITAKGNDNLPTILEYALNVIVEQRRTT